MPRVLAVVLLVSLAAACTGGEQAAIDPEASAVPVPVPAATTPAPAPSPAVEPTPTDPPPEPSQPPTPAPVIVPTTGSPEVLGTFDLSLAPEASGIVASRTDPDLLWLVDDGPGTTSILGVRHSGELVTEVQMEGVVGRDTEDIAIGPCAADDPSPCIYVGDIGDNNGVRDRILVHRFPEPAAGATTTAVTTASYTYPTGPVDAEALLVGADGLPVILTKEREIARVMAATAFADGELVQVSTLPILAPRLSLLTMFVDLTITAADSTPDGQRVILRTYDHIIELTAPQPDSPLTSLGDWAAVELPSAIEPQGEAVAYLPDGVSYVTVSEQVGTISVVRR
ncbi:hypothetical protein BH23ACT9_BH23ACT9_27390 [soil metagenome]